MKLNSIQVDMVASLNTLTWRKCLVYIHNTHSSHAAIILRTDKSKFGEGKVGLKLVVDEEFPL